MTILFMIWVAFRAMNTKAATIAIDLAILVMSLALFNKG